MLNFPLSPGARFSASPIIFSPSLISNSSMVSESLFVISKFVGPGSTVIAAGGQPSLVISAFTVLAVPLAFAPAPLFEDQPPPARAIAVAIAPNIRTERRTTSPCRSSGNGNGIPFLLRGLRRNQHEARHRDRVREPHDRFTDSASRLYAEHAGQQGGPHAAGR